MGLIFTYSAVFLAICIWPLELQNPPSCLPHMYPTLDLQTLLVTPPPYVPDSGSSRTPPAVLAIATSWSCTGVELVVTAVCTRGDPLKYCNHTDVVCFISGLTYAFVFGTSAFYMQLYTQLR